MKLISKLNKNNLVPKDNSIRCIIIRFEPWLCKSCIKDCKKECLDKSRILNLNEWWMKSSKNWGDESSIRIKSLTNHESYFGCQFKSSDEATFCFNSHVVVKEKAESKDLGSIPENSKCFVSVVKGSWENWDHSNLKYCDHFMPLH